MKNDVIETCPHCGGEARLTANYSPKTKLWFINVKCQICGGVRHNDTATPNKEKHRHSRRTKQQG